MRFLALALLLLAGCGPRVIRSYQWGPAHTDVIWLWNNGQILRCYLSTAGPLCAGVPTDNRAHPPLPMAGLSDVPVMQEK